MSESFDDHIVSTVGLQSQPFWSHNPRGWFHVVECQFNARSVKSQRHKFDHVVPLLPESIIMEIMDILDNPPDCPYDALKEAVLKTCDSDRSRIRKLFPSLELGDDKPSKLLRQLKHMIEPHQVSDSLLRELWLQLLPQNIQIPLAASDATDLVTLAQKADNAWEVTQKPSTMTVSTNLDSKIAELEAEVSQLRLQLQRYNSPRSSSRTPSRSRMRPRSPPKRRFCWYHQKYGSKARRCDPPCSWRSQKFQGND